MHTFVRLLLLALLFQGLLAAGCARPKTALDAEYIEAQEFKLKIRELADQMLATTPNGALSGLVAMPTSFVNLDNKRQTSPLGNLMAESLFYEFNQRGFPVREYRLTGNIDVILGQGDFSLLRQGLVSTVGQSWAALIVGTYYRDKDAVFVNARLVRASDGMVLRTAQLVLVNNALVARLSEPLAAPVPPASSTASARAAAPVLPTASLSSGTLAIKPAPWKAPSTKGRGPGLWGVQP